MLDSWLARGGRVVAVLLALCCACGEGDAPGPSPDPPLPAQDAWWADRVFYEVFVRSFADSAEGPLANDGIGDLRGLTARLDALNDGDPETGTDLGVGALWLMPIHPSPSYHGYDVTDYRAVSAEYGTLADFDAFIAAAHARGMKVIMDFVANHSSSRHPWFQDARSSPTSARRGYYQWSPTYLDWRQPWNGTGTTWHADASGYFYAVFWREMPDLNWLNPAVEAELLDAMKFWLARGVDGFRIDAVRYLVETAAGQADLPETHAALRRIRRALQLAYPDVLLVGEAWTTTQTIATYWGTGEELQRAFAFGAAEAIVTGVATGNGGSLLAGVSAARQVMAGKDLEFQAPFLTNHDQLRVMRQLGGDAAATRVAAAVLLALPGTPFLYYGEELGMAGGAGGADECKRTPFRWDAIAPGHGFTAGTAWSTRDDGATETDWTPCPAPEPEGVDFATQRADPGSLWNLYRRLIALRASHPALASGPLAYPVPDGGGSGLVPLLAGGPGERVLFLANVAATATGTFTVNVTGTPAVLLSEGLDAPPSVDAGRLRLAGLGPRGFAFIALD